MNEVPEEIRNMLIEHMETREAVVAAIEPCSLTDYRKIVRKLGSGYDSSVLPDGQVQLEERLDDSKRFHYTWMPTAEYRARFGYLSYSSRSGTSFTMTTRDSVREYANLPIFTTPVGAHRIPLELAGAASVELTGVIHPETNFDWVWEFLYPRWEKMDPGHSPRRWPAETGGDNTLQRILDLARKGRSSRDSLAKIATLLYPERKRLYGLMKNSIQQTLDLIYGTGESNPDPHSEANEK